MAEFDSKCVNCCVPVYNNDKIRGAKIVNKPLSSDEAVEEQIYVSSVLNFIYKSSGKEMPVAGGGETELYGLCLPCWNIIFQLYNLHKKLQGLTRLDSLINQTFNVLGPVVSTSQEIGTASIPATFAQTEMPVIVKTESLRVGSENSRAKGMYQLNSVDRTTPPRADDNNTDIDMPSIPECVMENEEESSTNTNNFDFEHRNSSDSAYADALSKYIKRENKGARTLAAGRYSGPCSEPNCTYTFEYSTRKLVLSHFREAHDRMIEFLPMCCHICGKTLTDRLSSHYAHFKEHKIDQLNAPDDCRSFNMEVLRSNCGLLLRRDEIKDDASVKSLRYQLKKNHVIKTRICRGLPIVENHPCPQCDQVFKWDLSLQRHIRLVHEGISKIKCPICEKPVLDKRAKLKHLRTHMNAQERAAENARLALEGQEFLCHECGKSFISKSKCNEHMKIHKPGFTRPLSKVFHCKERDCGYSCRSSATLKTHLSSVHSDSNYYRFRCPRCNQGFRTAIQSKNHRGYCCDPVERPHLCGDCGKRFKLKQHLEVHYLEVHKYEKEAARAVVYPGLPLRPSLGAKRTKFPKKKNK